MPRIETYNQGPRRPDTVQQTNITEDAFRRDFVVTHCIKIY